MKPTVLDPSKPRAFRLDPNKILVLSFAGLILLGAGLLTLPQAATNKGLSLVDALFTACSAVCVTGLVVVDTGKDLSMLGQAVVLGLIQLGGLGIMTFSTFLLLLVGRGLSFGTRRLMADTFHHRPAPAIGRLIRHIVVFTFILEALGALLLWTEIRGLKLPGGHDHLWWAAFHSVSAFCNAGFGLHGDSFVGFQANHLINFTVMGLIVTGGLGFVVLEELWNLLRLRSGPRLSLHAKLVLILSAGLILGGAAVLLLLEHDFSLAPLTWPSKILVALFQSVTARTAGFNTIDLNLFSNASLFIIIGLMFVGASPGSCGGGVKTTTVTVFWAVLLTRLRSGQRPRLLKRSLPAETTNRAVSVVVASGLLVAGFVILVLLTMAESGRRADFVAVFFEVVSAFGTVGLSLGITPSLPGLAKVLITVLMFVGRLGPLTLAVAIQGADRPERFYYAEESVMIG